MNCGENIYFILFKRPLGKKIWLDSALPEWFQMSSETKFCSAVLQHGIFMVQHLCSVGEPKCELMKGKVSQLLRA